jgi:DNA-binding transcriptional LysR family regulator
MGTIDLNLVRAAVAVHETASFSAAATRLGVPRSTVSRSVAALEDALGVRLFQRTTRKVATTAAGLSVIDRMAPALANLEASLSDVPEHREEPTGTLRITATADLATVVMAEVVARFVTRYPEVRVEVEASNEHLDLIRGNLDLALRVALEPLRQSALIARKVGTISLRLYASPQYLARRGVPRSDKELFEHDMVAFKGMPLIARAWNASQRAAFKKLVPRIDCNDMFFAREALRAGAGIGALPTFLTDGDLQSGALVRVLPQWSSQVGHVYVVHPGKKHVPRRVTAFRELLLETLQRRPLSNDGDSPVR